MVRLPLKKIAIKHKTTSPGSLWRTPIFLLSW
jgi:hypothetical protein